MYNRESLHPGRVKMIPVAGQENVYDMTMADDPTQEGDPPTKQNLLQDITCDVLQISRTSVVNDALLSLGIGLDRYGFLITVTDPAGVPVPGAVITGIDPVVGDTLETGTDGAAVGVSSTSAVTLTIQSPYLDLQSVTELEVSSDQKLHQVSVQLPYVDTYVLVESSGEYVLSPSVTSYDVTAVGGGGGGVGQSNRSTSVLTGGGGGGGYVVSELAVSVSDNRKINITVGAGGAAYNTYPTTDNPNGPYPAGNGGTTIVTVDDIEICSASGGNGGIGHTTYSSATGGNGNGKGGNSGANGTNGSGFIFNDESLGLAGGGGGNGFNTTKQTGGSPFGATGGRYDSSSKTDIHAGTARGPGGGGGGGGGYGNMMGAAQGSSGHAGAVYLRFYR